MIELYGSTVVRLKYSYIQVDTHKILIPSIINDVTVIEIASTFVKYAPQNKRTPVGCFFVCGKVFYLL